MWDLILSVPDHCLSFYFLNHVNRGKDKYLYFSSDILRQISLFADEMPCLAICTK